LALGLSKLLTLCSLNSSGCMGSFVICTGYSEQNRSCPHYATIGCVGRVTRCGNERPEGRPDSYVDHVGINHAP
jgi:hypothetical protein